MNTVAILARLQGLVGVGTRAAAAVLARCETLPGFGFSETMAGTIQLRGDDKPRKIVFHLAAAAPRLLDFLRAGRTEAIGDISIDGLVSAAAVTGGLWIWPQRRVIRYELDFCGDDGQRLRLLGQKDVRLLHFHRTMTTLPAELVTESGESLGQADVHFAIADLPAFVHSFHAHADRAIQDPGDLRQSATRS